MYQTNAERLPKACPRHPDDAVVVTDKTEVAMGYVSLTQYRCGHRDCAEGLGWMFRDRRVGGKPGVNGPGACDDQSVLHEMDRLAYSDITAGISIISIVATAGVGLATLAVGQQLGGAGLGVGIAITTAGVAGIAAFITGRRRGRPAEL